MFVIRCFDSRFEAKFTATLLLALCVRRPADCRKKESGQNSSRTVTVSTMALVKRFVSNRIVYLHLLEPGESATDSTAERIGMHKTKQLICIELLQKLFGRPFGPNSLRVGPPDRAGSRLPERYQTRWELFGRDRARWCAKPLSLNKFASNSWLICKRAAVSGSRMHPPLIKGSFGRIVELRFGKFQISDRNL